MIAKKPRKVKHFRYFCKPKHRSTAMDNDELNEKVRWMGNVVTDLLFGLLVTFESLEQQGIVSRENFVRNMKKKSEQVGSSIFEKPAK